MTKIKDNSEYDDSIKPLLKKYNLVVTFNSKSEYENSYCSKEFLFKSLNLNRGDRDDVLQ